MEDSTRGQETIELQAKDVLRQKLDEIEKLLPSLLAHLSAGECYHVALRYEMLVNRIRGQEAIRRQQLHQTEEESSSLKRAALERYDGNYPPPEVLRQILPFLTAADIGRSMVLTSKSLQESIGSELIWKAICEATWPPRQQDQIVIGVLGSYQSCFRDRHKSIQLAREDLEPLASPRVDPRIPNTLHLVLEIWNASPNMQLLLSESCHDLRTLCEEGSMTILLSNPVLTAQLASNNAHGWKLPNLFESSQARARLQLFHLEPPSEDDSSQSEPSMSSPNKANSAPVLLDTKFSVWRGWAKHAEATFLQRERTVGLRLTDRGQWIQHRIIQCRHPRWMNYLGLQFKVVLVCEPIPSTSNLDGFVAYGITKARIEAIRLHENSSGNIQHYLFRKDQGWQKHGVTLSHLIQELC